MRSSVQYPRTPNIPFFILYNLPKRDKRGLPITLVDEDEVPYGNRKPRPDPPNLYRFNGGLGDGGVGVKRPRRGRHRRKSVDTTLGSNYVCRRSGTESRVGLQNVPTKDVSISSSHLDTLPWYVTSVPVLRWSVFVYIWHETDLRFVGTVLRGYE